MAEWRPHESLVQPWGTDWRMIIWQEWVGFFPMPCVRVMLCNPTHVMMSMPKEFCRKVHSKLLHTKIWMVYLDYKTSELLTCQKAVRSTKDIKFWFWDTAWASTAKSWSSGIFGSQYDWAFPLNQISYFTCIAIKKVHLIYIKRSIQHNICIFKAIFIVT